MGRLSGAAAELGPVANLAVLRGDAVFYLDSAEGPKRLLRDCMTALSSARMEDVADALAFALDPQ